MWHSIVETGKWSSGIGYGGNAVRVVHHANDSSAGEGALRVDSLHFLELVLGSPDTQFRLRCGGPFLRLPNVMMLVFGRQNQYRRGEFHGRNPQFSGPFLLCKLRLPQLGNKVPAVGEGQIYVHVLHVNVLGEECLSR